MVLLISDIWYIVLVILRLAFFQTNFICYDCAFGAAVAAHLWCLDGLHGRGLQKLDWLMCSTGQSQPKFIISNFVPSHTTIHCRKTITSSSSCYAKLALPCHFTLCHCTWSEKYFVNHAGSLCVEQCLVDAASDIIWLHYGVCTVTLV